MLVPWAAALPRALRSGRGSAAASVLLLTVTALSACERGGDYPQTTFRPVSAFGHALNDVFYNTFWATMIVLVIVIALILYAAFRFRERPGTPPPPQIHGNTLLEVGWTLVPALIVVWISVPTVKAIFDTQRRPPDEALVVEVIGHQWWWEFRYPEYDVNTANVLYIPTDRPISLVMHSADVIHSFWVPKIGGKRDVNPLPRRREGVAAALPNYITFTVTEPGHYAGQCAEFCGEAHGVMRMSTMAVRPDEFDAWVARMRAQPVTVSPLQPPAADTTAQAQTAAPAQTPAPMQTPPVQASAPAQMQIGQMPVPTGAGNPFRAPLPDTVLEQEGKRIFLSAPCVACHAVTGTTAAGTIGPNLTLFGTRPQLGAGALENSRANLIRWITDPQAVKPGALMPGTTRGAAGMAPTGLSDIEVRAVAAYLASLR